MDGETVPPGIDTTRAHPARVYDYWLGGKDNFAADREAAEQALQAYPQLAQAVQANRKFLARAVRYLTGETGIRQFLDVGTGIPAADNTHQVAQREAPDSRIVYVDNDPIVLLHAQALLKSTPQGACDYIQADLRDPDAILAGAATTLDFGQPIAITMLGVLWHVMDNDEAYAIIGRLMEVMPSGSYLALNHPTLEVTGEKRRSGSSRSVHIGGLPRSSARPAKAMRRAALREKAATSAATTSCQCPALPTSTR